MLRKPANRIVRAVTDLLWERDRLQMQAIDTLSSAIERQRLHSSRRAAQKHRRRSKGTT